MRRRQCAPEIVKCAGQTHTSNTRSRRHDALVERATRLGWWLRLRRLSGSTSSPDRLDDEYGRAPQRDAAFCCASTTLLPSTAAARVCGQRPFAVAPRFRRADAAAGAFRSQAAPRRCRSEFAPPIICGGRHPSCAAAPARAARRRRARSRRPATPRNSWAAPRRRSSGWPRGTRRTPSSG